MVDHTDILAESSATIYIYPYLSLVACPYDAFRHYCTILMIRMSNGEYLIKKCCMF